MKLFLRFNKERSAEISNIDMIDAQKIVNRLFDDGKASDQESIDRVFSVEKLVFLLSQEPKEISEKHTSCAKVNRKETE